VAYQIMKVTKKNVECMGLKDKTAGFSLETDNLPPTENEIVEKVIKLIS
jgi:hypothetical protein